MCLGLKCRKFMQGLAGSLVLIGQGTLRSGDLTLKARQSEALEAGAPLRARRTFSAEPINSMTPTQGLHVA